MKQTKIIMGFPITVEIIDQTTDKDFSDVFSYFRSVDKIFSTYKKTSAISKFNRREVQEKDLPFEVKHILQLSEKTKEETHGFFNIYNKGYCDPSGLVKGWAIQNAFKILEKKGFKNFYIDAGGDIQAKGVNKKGKPWSVGIRNPFNRDEIIKVLQVDNNAVATSGTYIRGQHIYNPHKNAEKLKNIVSLTVIGPSIYDADRFATAAFAMQEKGILFIERLSGFEGYMVDKEGMATYTSGFSQYTI